MWGLVGMAGISEKQELEQWQKENIPASQGLNHSGEILRRHCFVVKLVVLEIVFLFFFD